MTDEDAAIADFLARLGGMFDASGNPATLGRMMGWLYVSPEPLQSSAQLIEALQSTSGTVSVITRQLEAGGFIERVKVPGRRGLFFRLADDALARTFIAQTQTLSQWRELFETMLAALPDEPLGRLDRLRQAYAFACFVEEELPQLVERWEQRKRELS